MRHVTATMALPSIEDARSLSTEELEAEMVTAKKDLFELRKKVKTRQQVKIAAPAPRPLPGGQRPIHTLWALPY